MTLFLAVLLAVGLLLCVVGVIRSGSLDAGRALAGLVLALVGIGFSGAAAMALVCSAIWAAPR